MTGSVATRPPTEVDALAERHLSAELELDPLLATSIGVAGFDDRLPDLSPDGIDARTALYAQTLDELAGAVPADAEDRVTIEAMRERLAVAADLAVLGVPYSELNNIASPVQSLRNIFDLMPTDTAEDWRTIARRLSGIPAAVDGYLQSLRLAASRGDVAALRQVRACIAQSAANLGPDGFFARLVHRASDLPGSLRADLDRGAHAAQVGYQQLHDFLADELLRQAPAEDAVGRDRYGALSRQFIGAVVDLEQTYDWGRQELARIARLKRETADRISPGASVEEAIAVLESDPRRKLTDTDALRAWMQDRADEAIEALAGTHFDIPEPMRRLECLIAPTRTGVIYYTNPSEDFSRPGRMWWSVPEGVTEFSTWRELTTVYHEGVPGHHLQVSHAVYNRDRLNSWRRLASWTSGHGEGWALYSEWLMADLGFMDEPGNRLGLLDGQSLRAARVVIDIGVHCGFPAPPEVGGGTWSYDKAWRLLTAHSHMSPEFLRFELERYLGWAGQAPSYKVGEKLWLELRDAARAQAGSAFDLKEFHRRTLGLGSVGLEVLRKAALQQW
jgi:uncharacterized protein (DUF885 family)